jgi:hypothetical protein
VIPQISTPECWRAISIQVRRWLLYIASPRRRREYKAETGLDQTCLGSKFVRSTQTDRPCERTIQTSRSTSSRLPSSSWLHRRISGNSRWRAVANVDLGQNESSLLFNRVQELTFPEPTNPQRTMSTFEFVFDGSIPVVAQRAGSRGISNRENSCARDFALARGKAITVPLGFLARLKESSPTFRATITPSWL